jgi:hypothetical protein
VTFGSIFLSALERSFFGFFNSKKKFQTAQKKPGLIYGKNIFKNRSKKNNGLIYGKYIGKNNPPTSQRK